MRYIAIINRALAGLGLALMAAAAMAAAPAGGQLQKITVHGASLAGNLSGDSADREVFVYLPPGYASSTQQRYPVVYFLHGFGATAQRYVDFLGWPDSIDRTLTGAKQEVIVVMPDAMTAYGGSMYSNSVTTGDWEAFVARDLVAHIDAHYRTVPRREARGLSGHSMGGYGTIRIGMKYPQVFSSLYAMSSCCLDPRGVTPQDAAIEKLTPEEVGKMTAFAKTTFASSAAWAGNVLNPPFYMDLPTKDGEPVDAVLAQFTANSPVAMASQYVPALQSFRAIRLDIGTQDFLIRGNEALVEALKRSGVPHSYETYDGDHMNQIAPRVEKLVLPWFAQQLVAK